MNLSFSFHLSVIKILVNITCLSCTKGMHNCRFAVFALSRPLLDVEAFC